MLFRQMSMRSLVCHGQNVLLEEMFLDFCRHCSCSPCTIQFCFSVDLFQRWNAMKLNEEKKKTEQRSSHSFYSIEKVNEEKKQADDERTMKCRSNVMTRMDSSLNVFYVAKILISHSR
jgi:hypothetical protein